ncbi:hypothetical protein ACR3H8_20525 [Pseudomonas aeruginosa]|uniref:hypothetical protein n=1 Tax=Pseudomonas aeruginosa group TaxID=136841 RepID=UPI000F5366BE|nr:hypothetical protein [Pseudomonas aeruginosa]EIU2716844.1 hypothetical protein [Pseudomonas aeruginosa]EIU2862409.1 hypothetical protein [Pseudomonas aeruginosa]ELD5772903.1 hypothetical protein [Pseudomonas aeruginosa]MBA5210238.1 hypothetical protein [Pseudomonas aeruginosa]MBG3916881.1 hypothetical protein [Pseudomonas aeruginosa]
MNVRKFVSKAAMVRSLLAECDSFERRGPKVAAAIMVRGSHVDVIKAEIDWAPIIGDKPMIDNRTENISDLIPSPRAHMQDILEGFSQKVGALSGDQTPRPKGPRM